MVAQRIAGGWPQLQLPSSDQAEFVICDHTIDITYIVLRSECVYLAVIMDVYTRCIRGWQLGALQTALKTRQPEIHHSDQGVQYAATAYTATT